MSPRPHAPPSQRLSLGMEGGRLLLEWYGKGEPPSALIAAGLARRGQRDGGSRVSGDGLDAWVKGGRLKVKSSLRHFVRRQAFARPFPRLQEARNLAWLRQHGIAAARPLLAGLFRSNGPLPTLQFLATEFEDNAVPLDQLKTDEPARFERARSAAAELLASMHAAGFVHRDAYWRNFLITHADSAIAIDTWRGGPKRHASRAAIARDLADFEAGL